LEGDQAEKTLSFVTHEVLGVIERDGIGRAPTTSNDQTFRGITIAFSSMFTRLSTIAPMNAGRNPRT
jgi:hypothetical protein